jgi:hypothetical protein
MTRTLILASLAAALIGAGVAAAKQTEPGPAAKAATAPTISGVTVDAPHKNNPLVDPTTQFVRQRVPMSRFEQYARFRDPICVKVIGLPAEYDAFVTKRIVDVARQVKAPVAGAVTCAPNINVIFSQTPQAQLTDIAKRRDILFGYVLPTDMKRVTAFSRPIQSWYLARSVGTHGDSQLEINTGADCISSHAPNQPPCDIKSPVIGRAGSRLGSDISAELVHSLILADTDKVSGQKIDAVADYIAVLALSQWGHLELCSGLPTILNLMADGCDAENRPEAATPADLALLTGLYRVNPREVGNLQRADIASAVRKASEDHRQAP